MEAKIELIVHTYIKGKLTAKYRCLHCDLRFDSDNEPKDCPECSEKIDKGVTKNAGRKTEKIPKKMARTK